MTGTRITVICENTVTPPFPFIGEHGLAFLIEQGDDATLFDTGQGFGIVHNMKKLGKDLRSVKRIVLSHGHYDHAGGLMAVLGEAGGTLPVYAHPAVFDDKLAVVPGGNGQIERAIGVPFTRKELSDAGAEFREVRGLSRITDSIRALSEVPRPDAWQGFDPRLMVRDGATLRVDRFNDDLSLVVETSSGPVVLLGCAHAGIIEILDGLARLTGAERFHAVLGGTHLEHAPAPYLDGAVAALRKYRVARIGPCHCSGFSVACRLAAEFPDAFVTASIGVSFVF